MKAEEVNDREISHRLTTRLKALQKLAAQQGWRGLLILQAPLSTTFLWPHGALVLQSQLNQYRHYLGTNQSLVVLDLRSSLHGDALAACLPTLSSGGLAIIILPLRRLSSFAQRLCANIPRPYAHHMILRSAERTSCVKAGEDLPLRGQADGSVDDRHQVVDIRHLKVQYPRHETFDHGAQLNEQQRAVLKRLHQHITAGTEAPALINAPRGRGKSTLLGILAARWMNDGYQVTVTAPSRRQLQSLQTSAQCALHFEPPDALVEKDLAIDIVILDEAASLPQQMLDALLQRYPRLVMATTSEGYETCGRGFLLRFQQRLASQFAGFLSCTLQDPVRFAPHCPIESWLHQVLLLSPRVRDTALPELARESLEYCANHASQLTEAELQACFYLLMDAHYQTSPNDLKLLLDDPKHWLVLQKVWHKNQTYITGVVWVCVEGELDSALAQAVVDGTRRPTGNLLAQGLAYYFQCRDAARARWWRVIRVAILPGLQNQGLGTQLIDYVTTQAPPDLAGVGTSFASSETINRFWRRSNFLPVRLGARKDPATGCHALIMLYPISPPWQDEVHQWATYWHAEVHTAMQIYGLSDAYFSALQPLPSATDNNYRQWAQYRVQTFVQGQLDISAVRLTLANLLAPHLAHDAVLEHMVRDSSLPPQLLQAFSLRGRKDAVEYVRRICLKTLPAI